MVLPVLDPPKGWSKYALSKKCELEKKGNCNVRLIVADDGSKNETEFNQLSIQDPSIRIVRANTNKGKGHSLRQGIALCQSDYILYTDADFPYEVESMVQVIDALKNGADVALGYREEDYYASVPWFRKGLSESFRYVLKSILKFPITDTQCGLKGMNQTGKSIFLKTKINRFLVDMEFIKLAVKQRIQIDAVVVQLRDNVEFSSMGISVLLREFLNFLRILFI